MGIFTTECMKKLGDYGQLRAHAPFPGFNLNCMRDDYGWMSLGHILWVLLASCDLQREYVYIVTKDFDICRIARYISGRVEYAVQTNVYHLPIFFRRWRSLDILIPTCVPGRPMHSSHSSQEYSVVYEAMGLVQRALGCRPCFCFQH